MIRRLAKAATILLAVGSVVFTVPRDFLEALTANLETLINTDGSLTEGDKTFSNFTFDTNIATAPSGTTLNLPEATDIDVTVSIGAGGVISIAFPLNMSAITSATAQGPVVGNISFGFDVTAADPNVISGITLTTTGDQAVGDSPSTEASVVAAFTGTGVGALGVGVPDSGSASFPGLPTVRVDTTADVRAGGTGESSEIDTVTLDIAQTTHASVPEPGSLMLLLGGAGMVLARSLSRRRAA